MESSSRWNTTAFPQLQRFLGKDILFFFRKFLQESSDLKLSWKFKLFRPGKIRSYSFPADLIPKTADLIPKPPDFKLPGNLDLIPFWQNLNIFQEFSPGNLRSDAFRDNQPCSVLFQSCFSLKQSCFRAVQGCFSLIQRCSALVKIRHILVWNSKKSTN